MDRKYSEKRRKAGLLQSEDQKRKNSKWHTGKHLSLETKEKLRKARLGCRHNKESIEKMRKARLGKHHTLETKKKMSEGRGGDKHPNWRGGLSRLPYSQDWTETLKESIRQRDDYVCQLCSRNKEENKSRLSVHHIDYDKKNCDPENLISLCRSCNTKVNSGRNEWTKFFRLRLKLFLAVS